MENVVFVDTNVLIYCRDSSEPEKQTNAITWMEYLWRTKTGRLSYQVLQEFYFAVTTKLKPGLDQEKARNDVRSLLAWRPIAIDDQVINDAWKIQDRYRLSWWDSLIASAADVAGCNLLLTEDLQNNQKVEGIRVINPFYVLPKDL